MKLKNLTARFDSERFGVEAAACYTHDKQFSFRLRVLDLKNGVESEQGFIPLEALPCVSHALSRLAKLMEAP